VSNIDPDDGQFPALETRVEAPVEAAPVSAPKPPKLPEDADIDLTKVDFSGQTGKLASAYESSARFNPDDNAATMRIAAKTGLPEPFVNANLPEARKSEGTVSKVFLDQIEKDYPNTAKFLSEPRNMAVAHDDIPNLVAQEDLYGKIAKSVMAAQRFINPGLAAADAFDSQLPWVSDLLKAGVAKMPNTALRLPAAMHTALFYADNLTEKIAELASPEGVTRLALGAAVGAPAQKLVGEVANPTPDSWYNNDATKYFDDLSASIAPIESTWSPIDKASHGERANAAKALAAQVLINAPNQAALLSMGLLGGWAQIAGLAGMGLQQATDVAARASAKGISPLVFAPAAAASGLAEAAFERMGTISAVKRMEGAFIKALNNGTKGRALAYAFGMQMFSGFAQEGSEEFGTSLTQDAIDYISGINPDMTLEKAVQNSLDAFLIGGTSGVAMTTPTAFMAGRQHMINSRNAESYKNDLVKMSKLVTASKVIARGAQFTDGHLPLVSEGGWQGLAHMTKEKLDATAESMGISSDALMQSVGGTDSYKLASNADDIVSMPLAKLTTRLGAHLANIAGDIKPSPDLPSANEAKVQEENRAEAFRVIGEDAAVIIKGEEADAEKSKARQSEYDSVKEEIVSQLDETFAGKDFKTDKTRREWIDSAATIHANMVTVAADKAGVSTKEWWAKNKTVTKAMEVINGSPVALNQTARTSQTETPEFKAWFGESKVLDDNGQPLVVYHGTHSDFTSFSRKFEIGTHLGDSAQAAERIDGLVRSQRQDEKGARTIPAFIRIKKPLRLRDLGSWSPDDVATELTKKGILEADTLNAIRADLARPITDGTHNDRQSGIFKTLIEAIEAAGYDGIVYKNRYEFPGSAEAQQKIDEAQIYGESVTAARKNFSELRKKNAGSDSYIVFHPDQIESALGNSGAFDPKDPNILKSENVGLYSHEQRLIALSRNANATTYLHEVQHSMVKYLEERAQKGEATEAELADLSVMAQYVGAKSGEAFSVKQHEKIAAAFVAYLETGKAPTPELRGAFRRIRDWFLKIVSEARATLGAQVTPEIADLFDRQIASESAIQKARAEAGMTDAPIPGEPDELTRIRAEARASAIEELVGFQQERLAAIKTEGMKDVEEKLRVGALSAVETVPVYKAETFLEEQLKLKPEEMRPLAKHLLEGTGGTEDDMAVFMAAAEVHGFEDWRDLAQALSESPTKTEAMNRLVSEQMSQIFAQDPEAIRAKAEEIVLSEQMDEVLELEREAIEALLFKRKAKADATAADKANRAIETSRRKAQRIHAKATAKDEAYRKLSSMGVQEGSNPRPWTTAERKAAERRAVAMSKKDYAAALKASGEQILAHAMASEAARNRADLTRKFRGLSKFVGPHPFITSEREAAAQKVLDLTAQGAPAEAIAKATEKLASLNRYNETIIPMRRKKFGFALQIDEALARFGLKESTDQRLGAMPGIALLMAGEGRTPADIADETGMVLENGQYRKEKLEEFVARIVALGYPINLPASVFKGSVRPTVQDIRDLSAAVKTIHSVGSGLQSFLEDWRKGDIKANAEAAYASARDGIGLMYASESAPLDLDLSLVEAAKYAVSKKVDGLKYGMGIVQFLTLANILDPNEKVGPWKDNTYRPLAAAESRELVRVHKNIEIIAGLINKFYGSNDAMNSSGEEVIWRGELNGIPQTLTRAKARIIALNMGNEGNRDRIRKSFGATQEEVMAMLEPLEKKDWDFAQAIGDHLKTFWPEIVKLEMDTKGVQPIPVKVSPVVTKFGTFEGWYYPLHYDSQKSSVVYGHAVDNNGIIETGGYSSAQTEQGHTETRAKEFGAAVLLDLRVLSDHLTNVIHDLEFRRSVIDVSRFLKDENTKAALEGAIGPTRANLMMDFLRDIAADKKESMDGIERGLRWFRYNTTFMALGFKLSSAVVDVPSNISVLSHERGLPGALSAMFDFYGPGMMERRAFIHSKSPRMAERMKFIDRDLNDMSRNWNVSTGKWAKFNKWRKYAFIVQVTSDQAISEPLWIATYNEAISEGDVDNAVHRADEAVTRTLGSGSMLDRSPFQKGPEYKKAFSYFFSWGQMMLGRFILENAQAKKELNDEHSVKSALIIGKSVALLWILPGFVESVMREIIRNSAKDDKEGRKKRMIARAALGPIGMLPLVRDVANYASGSSKKSTAKLDLTPTARSIEILLKPWLNITHGKTKDLPVDIVNMASLATGTPQSVTNILVNYMKWQSGQGGQLAWKDLLSRRTKK